MYRLLQVSIKILRWEYLQPLNCSPRQRLLKVIKKHLWPAWGLIFSRGTVNLKWGAKLGCTNTHTWRGEGGGRASSYSAAIILEIRFSKSFVKKAALQHSKCTQLHRLAHISFSVQAVRDQHTQQSYMGRVAWWLELKSDKLCFTKGEILYFCNINFYRL